ncbi:uncharacterized protein LOC105697586 [Orussus abietinus]|uniref:uncharacterized protein LOC105697586 n=1 Tax=Orussus abietinus TaxID=222816 RepID=UPI000C715D8F|nr:uncharacterized protein LOC105697586 [Orussus abietinus]
MYKERNGSASGGGSGAGGEVELVSRFLAPLCARDEAARNIALAAARTTVEGWLGGVGSPNQWEDASEMEDNANEPGKFKGQDGRYDMSVERSPSKSAPKNVHGSRSPLLQDTFRTEGFFPQSVTEHPAFPKEASLEPSDRFSSGSFDAVDGRFGNEAILGIPGDRRLFLAEGAEKFGHSASSDEGKDSKLLEARCLRPKDSDSRSKDESRFGSSTESERKFLASSIEQLNEYEEKFRAPRDVKTVKVKGAKQKVEDDEPDSDTRVYGKSPKFDENFGALGKTPFTGEHYEGCNAAYVARNLTNMDFGFSNLRRTRGSQGTGIDDELPSVDGVVFNTLDGFENENMNLEDPECLGFNDNEEIKAEQLQFHPEVPQDYLRNTESDRKFSAGQIKRPLSQDEDVSPKSNRVLESPEVSPGDVGRMLNLGNALDGPRQTQANKYLSLVTLHLPVILRLSVNCPFQNVRIKCAEILQMVKDRGLPVPEPAFDGPSAFVPTSEVEADQEKPKGPIPSSRTSGGNSAGHPEGPDYFPRCRVIVELGRVVLLRR